MSTCKPVGLANTRISTGYYAQESPRTLACIYMQPVGLKEHSLGSRPIMPKNLPRSRLLINPCDVVFNKQCQLVCLGRASNSIQMLE